MLWSFEVFVSMYNWITLKNYYIAMCQSLLKLIPGNIAIKLNFLATLLELSSFDQKLKTSPKLA